MRCLPLSSEQLRAMYAGGRGNATARRYALTWATVFGLGLAPRRWVTLEVAGRHTGRVTRFPLGMADWNGHWYLVPMLGENCNWVRNVRAAHGHVTLRHRKPATIPTRRSPRRRTSADPQALSPEDPRRTAPYAGRPEGDAG